MKRLVTLLVFIASLMPIAAVAQNVQIHFDPRHSVAGSEVAARNYATATFEMFKADKCGSTFLFADIDFNQSRANMGLAYAEISREFKIKTLPVMAHLEINGGVGKSMTSDIGFTISSAYLAGVSYATVFKGWILSTHLSYKLHSFDKFSHDVQWTGVWAKNFFQDKVTFSGFVDVWTENKHRSEAGFKSGKRVVVLTEPQVWYNINGSLSLGTEIEISNNFIGNKAYVLPTVAAKWTF